MLEILVFVVVAVLALFGSLTQLYPGNAVLVVTALIWAIAVGGQAWWWFAGVTAVVVASIVVKYLVPARYLKRQGIANSTLLVGALFAVVGFFLIPVVGLFVGFPVGVYVAEFARDRETALARTWVAVKGIGATILVEVVACILALGIWAGGLWVL